MPAVERHLLVRNAAVAQPLPDLAHDFGSDELVRPPVYERQSGGSQPLRHHPGREIEIGWELTAPQHQPIDARLPQRRPAADRGRPLRKADRENAHGLAASEPADVSVYGVEIPHVVLDLVEAGFATHA